MVTCVTQNKMDEGEVSDSDDDNPVLGPVGDGGAEVLSHGMQTDSLEQDRTDPDSLTVWDRKRPVFVEVAEPEPSEGEVIEDMESSRPKLYKFDLRECVNASKITIPEGLAEDTPLLDAARLIARSLREPKTGLVMDVLTTIGFQRTMDMLRETKVVQETGGMETKDGKKPKRSAGGVFLTLLKSHASSEEVKQVYAREKAMAKKKARMSEGSSKAKKKKYKRKQKSKQESSKADTGQDKMEEAKHRKVPDRRQLISYKDLSDVHTLDSNTAVAPQGQSVMEEKSTGQASATVEVAAAEDNEGVINEETRLAVEFDSKDAPDGLDLLDFDWY